MTKFQKGMKRPSSAGRKKGTPNKTTEHARQAIADLVDSQLDRLPAWLDEIHEKDGALAAFKCVTSLLEYYIPKMNRMESTHDFKNTPPVVIVDNIPNMTAEEAAKAYQKLIKGL